MRGAAERALRPGRGGSATALSCIGCSQRPEAVAILMRRTLTVTSAPILNNLRRMVPQVALASSPAARRRKLSIRAQAIEENHRRSWLCLHPVTRGTAITWPHSPIYAPLRIPIPASCRAQSGEVHHPQARKTIRYGELAADASRMACSGKRIAGAARGFQADREAAGRRGPRRRVEHGPRTLTHRRHTRSRGRHALRSG
jgi:hypothetical protein